MVRNKNIPKELNIIQVTYAELNLTAFLQPHVPRTFSETKCSQKGSQPIYIQCSM